MTAHRFSTPAFIGLVVLLFLASVATINFTAAAIAQDGQIGLDQVFEPFKPYLMELASIAAVAVGGWLLKRFHDWTGIEMESRRREALQSALENAARLVIERIGDSAAGKGIPVGNAILETGVEYVLQSVPDAVKGFGLTPERIGDLIRPKLVARR